MHSLTTSTAGTVTLAIVASCHDELHRSAKCFRNGRIRRYADDVDANLQVI